MRELNYELNLESLIPEAKRIIHIMKPIKLVRAVTLKLCSSNSRDKVLERISGMSCLSMEFTTPGDVPYDEYVYDVTDNSSVIESLSKYLKDYGKLWKHGLIPPSCLSAFHDFSTNRRHHILSHFAHHNAEGSLEQWNGQATNYPNIGGPKMGMPDKVDITLPVEKEHGYFGTDNRNSLSVDDPCCNMIRYEDLARSAQGVCLLYARRFNSNFNYNSEKKVLKRSKKI